MTVPQLWHVSSDTERPVLKLVGGRFGILSLQRNAVGQQAVIFHQLLHQQHRP